MPESVQVRYRSVVMTVYPWQHPSGRQYWRYKHGGKAFTRASLDKAKAEAHTLCKATFRGSLDLADLTPEQVNACQRMIDADPSCALVDEFLVWHGKRAPQKNSKEAIAEFMALKKQNAGSSKLNCETLEKHLSALPDAMLCTITAATLPPLHGSPRTRANRRAAWVTFFRWCVAMGYLPYGEQTAPERLEKPIITRTTPSTYTRAQLDVLLANARPAYLPWVALAALAGIRTEEIHPQPGSKKSPLMWEDVNFERGIITVRPETAKTKHRRVIPICPLLKSILLPIAGKGRIGPMTHPADPSSYGTEPETNRLGSLIGGWKRNALRHSFISYRAAQVGLAKTAMEAGNSESEAKKSYNDAKSEAEAEEWFKGTFGEHSGR